MHAKNTTPDWLIRTVKTFVQVFFGTLIPALIVACETPPDTWAGMLPWLGGIFTPTLIVGDCLTAGICAMWNCIKEMNAQ